MPLLLALLTSTLSWAGELCLVHHDTQTHTVVTAQLDGLPIAQISPDTYVCTTLHDGPHTLTLTRVAVHGPAVGSKLVQVLSGQVHYTAQLAHIVQRYTTHGDHDLQLPYEVKAAVQSGAWDSEAITVHHARLDVPVQGDTVVLETRGAGELATYTQSEAWLHKRKMSHEDAWAAHPEAWLLFRLADGATFTSYPELLNVLGLTPLHVEATLDELLDDEALEGLPD